MVCSLLRGPWSVTRSAVCAADFVGSGCSLRLILEWACGPWSVTWSVTWSVVCAADFVGSGCSLRLILEWACGL